ncbi:sugar transporter [Photobacterium damselae subsp. damselae]|uniref:GumC family protein n=1 Tax=Photobacterium damselae TaxID=38293 RepID=UPI00311B0E18
MRQLILAKLYAFCCALWMYRYMVLVPMITLPILLPVGSLFKTKMYYSQTTILVQEAAMLNPFLGDLSISMNLQQRMKALTILLHSQSTLEQVVIDLELATKEDRGQVAVRVGELKQHLNLSLLSDELVSIGLTWKYPSEVPVILNAVSNIFLDKLRAPGRASIDNSEQFLQQQLTITQQELEQAETELAAFKMQNANDLPHLRGMNEQANIELNRQLHETELNLMAAKSSRDNLYQRLARTNPLIGMLEQEIVDSESRLALLRASYTDKHSKIRSELRKLSRLQQKRAQLLELQQSLTPEQINQLWQRIANETQAQASTSHPLLLSQFEKLQDADEQIAALTNELNLLQQKATYLSEKRNVFTRLEKQLTALERNYKVKANIYDQLLERFEMAKVTGQLGRFEDPDKLKVIDKPSIPTQPLNWPWWLNMMIGFILGIILGLSTTALLMLLDSRIYQREQLQRISDIPTLTEIPNFHITR